MKQSKNSKFQFHVHYEKSKSTAELDYVPAAKRETLSPVLALNTTKPKVLLSGDVVSLLN